MNAAITILVLTLLSLTGCASVDTAREWDTARTFAVERTGAEPRWEKTSDDASTISDEVNTLLAGGLTEDEAVSISLMNNRRLQALFEGIGIAKADLVQAGLFSNPDFSAVLRFPFGGGGADIEAAGILRISDLWERPVRKKAAEAELEAVLSGISEEMLSTASETRTIFNGYIALSMIKVETENIRKQFDELRQHLEYRQKFGLEHEVGIYMANAAGLEQQLELMKLERDLQVQKSRLDHILGLSPDSYTYEIRGVFPDRFRMLPELEVLLAYAYTGRPDVRIAEKRIEEAEQILALEKLRIFREIGAGPSYARDTDGTDSLGAEIKFQLPLFDRNQAQVSKAGYRVRQARKDLENRRAAIRQEVSSLLDSLNLAGREVDFIKNEILPIRRDIVRYAEKYGDAMQMNMLYIIEARQKRLEADRQLLEAMRSYRNLEIELERVLGGKIPAHNYRVKEMTSRNE